jgi:hypothetical protein
VISATVLGGASQVGFVEGFQGIPAKRLPVSKLVARILCGAHNQGLSSLDSAAGDLSKAVQRFRVDGLAGQVTVSGTLLERWLLKTTINLQASGWSSDAKARPAAGLVRAAHGLDPFPEAAGLHTLAPWRFDQPVDAELAINAVWATHPELGRRLEGCFIRIHGLPLYLSLGLPPPCLPLRIGDYDLAVLDFRRRPDRLFIATGAGAELTITFDWTGVDQL